MLASIAVRAVWLYLSWGLFFHSDERDYLGFAETWARAGTYHGEWAPLHVFFLGSWIDWFGPESGVRIARCALSAASVLTGIALMGIGTATAGSKAGRAAGWIWAFYLPLIPFAHVLLSEGLQMLLLFSCLWLLVVARSRQGTDRWTGGRVVLAGVCMGGASLARDASILWLAAVTVWCVRELHVRRALAFAATALLVIAPWSASVSRDIGGFQLLGRTAGINAYFGWNAHYVNIDHGGGLRLDQGAPGSALRAQLIEPPPGVEPWSYEFHPGASERQRDALGQGLAFITANPVFFLRTRIVKAADLLTPLSYMVRFLRVPSPAEETGQTVAPGARTFAGYRSAIPSLQLRSVLAVVALASAIALMLLAVLGMGTRSFTAGGSALWLCCWGATLPMILIVTMSRFRAPLDGLMMIPAAVMLVGREKERDGGHGPLTRQWQRLRIAATAAALTCIFFLWYLAIPSVHATLRELS